MNRRHAALFVGSGVVGLVVAFLVLRNPDSPLTHQALEDARATWKAKGPSNYRYELDVNGTLYAVRVLDGRVARMTLDGRDAPEGAWKHWDVEGMFGFLETELDNAAHPQRAYGVEDPESVVLRAAFDPDLGIPRRFFRHVVGRGMTTRWELRAFEAK